MNLWRISNYQDVSGIGAAKFPGRWNDKGVEVVYTAESPALAMLEILVQNGRATLPDTYSLLEISCELEASHLNVPLLKVKWYQDQKYTKKLGSDWLIEKGSLLMRVPSVIMPHSFNVLVNPNHRDIDSVKIVSATVATFDPRLR